MKVIDKRKSAWFLLEEESRLFFDVNCEASVFGYSWQIQLNAQEADEYHSAGRAYLDELAEKIRYSHPMSIGSSSPFAGRRPDQDCQDAILRAIVEHRLGGSR